MKGRGGKDRRAQQFRRGLSEICPLSSVIIPFGNARQRMLNHKSLILRHATLCNATQHTRIRIVNPPATNPLHTAFPENGRGSLPSFPSK